MPSSQDIERKIVPEARGTEYETLFSSREAGRKTLFSLPRRQAKCFVLFLRPPDLRVDRWSKLQVAILEKQLESTVPLLIRRVEVRVQDVSAKYDDIELALRWNRTKGQNSNFSGDTLGLRHGQVVPRPEV